VEYAFQSPAPHGPRPGSDLQSTTRFHHSATDTAVSDTPHGHGSSYEELCSRHAELLLELEQLRAARDEAVTTSRTTSQFLSRLSQELLPPLSALLATDQTLLTGGGGPKNRRMAELQRVQSAGRNLLALLNRKVTCGGCQKRLHYRLKMAGSSCRCPHCGHRFQLPPLVRTANRPTSPTAPRPARRRRSWLLQTGAGIALLLTGLALGALLAGPDTPVPSQPQKYSYSYSAGMYSTNFKDDVQSNADHPPAESLALDFVDSNGGKVDLHQYRGKKNVVLVINRGFNGYVCLTCQTITSRLIQNYKAFTSRDTEVLVVYPGPRGRVTEFIEAVRANSGGATLPFPVLLDEDMRVVKRLGIEADLAKPSTYILDKAGQVRFAYVGSAPSDRPSVKALLDQLDRLVKR
jgi:peroxiredoxin